MPSQNINAGTIAPIINPELIPVDLDPEEDLEEIQHKAAAEQVRIEEAAQAKLAAACKCIKRKRKAEEDEALRKKAKEDAHRWQLSVSCRFYFILCCVGTDLFQMLKKRKEAKKARWVDVDRVSTGT